MVAGARHRPPSSVYTLQRNWQGWSEKTHPKVSTQLVLAGREKNASDLLSNLSSPGVSINIQADSPEEAVEFVYSVIASSDDALFRENFLARSIVIGNVNDASRFRDTALMHNIILCPPATSESVSLARCGHTVVNSLGNKSVSHIDIRLTRSLRTDFSNALVAMGKSKEEADLEARACGCSPSIWRIWNLLKHGDPGDNVPDWAKYEYRELVVPAVLLGGWSEEFEGDKKVINLLPEKIMKNILAYSIGL